MTQLSVSLKELVEMHTSEMYRWTLHKVSDEEVAKDLVQDTFLAAAEKFGSFSGNSSHKTWLFAILNNKIIDHYRRKIGKAQLTDSIDTGSFFSGNGSWVKDKAPNDWHEEEGLLLDNPEFREVLGECLEALPEVWRICVTLKYLSEKKGEDICQELDITPTNLWQIIHRAKLNLRECVETNWFKN